MKKLVLAISLLTLSCGDDTLIAPTVIATPSPILSPLPTPAPRIAASCQIRGDGIIFGLGPKQPRELNLFVFDSDKTLIENKAGHWSHGGPIQPIAEDNGTTWRYFALLPGFATVNVSVEGTPGCQFRITIVESFDELIALLLKTAN